MSIDSVATSSQLIWSFDVSRSCESNHDHLLIIRGAISYVLTRFAKRTIKALQSGLS